MIGRRLLVFLLCCFPFVWNYGQFFDDFNDGDFTNSTGGSAIWGGETSLFNVSAGFELQSNGNSGGSDTLYLTTPNTLMDSAEWNFTVELDFNPSSTNYVRVYLVSNQANLQGNLNGYFIQLGEAGSAPDSIDLFRQDGASITKILTGSLPCINSSTNNRVDVRVRRDPSGNWEVLADCAGGGSYVSHGTVTDNTHTTTSIFGVYCKYSTSSRFNLYFFDDINVSQIVGDTVRPVISSLTPISATELDVKFSEPVDLTTCQVAANYGLDNGIGAPVSALRDGTDLSLVHLTFGTAFTSGTTYTLTVNNVEDLAANSILAGSTDQFLYFVPVTPSWRDVVINEIFADPTPQVGLPTEEYIELYNASSSTFDLSGWTFSDPSTTGNLGSYVLAPGAYVILCANADTALFSPFGPVLGISPWPSLNNTSDQIGLQDGSGTLVDSVEYLLSWYQDGVKDDGGWSLELINPIDTCAVGASNWIASNDVSGGTPGVQNSVYSIAPDTSVPAIASTSIIAADTVRICFTEAVTAASISNLTNYSLSGGTISIASVDPIGPPFTCVNLVLSGPIDTGTVYVVTMNNLEDCAGNSQTLMDTFLLGIGAQPFDILINEIFPDFDPQVALPQAEFVELYNRTGNYITIQNWTFNDASSTVTIPDYTFSPGEYVILTADANAADYAPFGTVLSLSSLPSLNNTSDSLDLRDGNGDLIHNVNYDISWYQDDTKDDGGWTLELINPSDACERLGNWIASNDVDGGTPGRQNSVYNNVPDIQPPVIESITVTGANSVQVCFNETMDPASLAIVTKYDVDNGLNNPVSATPIASDFNCVDLIFATNIDTGTIYTLQVLSVNDCQGISSGIITGTFVLGGNAGPGDVVITEFFPDPDPSVSLPNSEFVEIHNRSQNVISLRDWMLTDRSASQAMLPAVNLFPGDYLIITATANEDTFALLGNTVGVSSFPSLNNTGDSLELYNSSGQLIDLAYYSDEWYADPNKEDGGWTIERVDVNFTCLNSGNWRASVDPSGGTPGAANSVTGVFSDSEAPSIERAAVIDPSIVRVYFDELMDESTISIAANYSIDNGIGTPLFAVSALSGFAADLLVAGSLDTNQLYCVTVTSVSDCPGNPISSSNTACFGIPIRPEPGDIVLNEILFNPYTGGSDYIELYNLSDKILDLKDLVIEEYDVDDNIVTESEAPVSTSYLFLPGTYICLTEDKASQLENYLPIDPAAILEINNLPTFPDNEGICVIKTDSGVTLDSLSYLDDWQFPNLDDDNGVSLERLSFVDTTQNENNWHSAASTVRYGTPGYENSQQVVENPSDDEVWVSPETFSPNDDGMDDFVSIFYRFTRPANVRITALDHKGRFVRVVAQNALVETNATLIDDTQVENARFKWDGTDENGRKVDIGIYVLLVEASYLDSGETAVFKLPVVVATPLD